MWKDIAALFGSNPLVTLLIVVVGTSTLWMYKEFKEILNRNNIAKLNLINERLKTFGKLEAAIALALKKPEDENILVKLYDILGESSALFTKEMREVTRTFYTQGHPHILSALQIFIDNQINTSREEKAELSKYENSTDVIDKIGRMIKPFVPIVFIWAFVLLLVSYVSVLIHQQDMSAKIHWTMYFFSVLISFMFVCVLLSVDFDNKLGKQGHYRWLLLSTIMITPFVFLLYTGLWWVSISIQVIAFILLIKKQKKAKNSLILLK
ncbi:hypothetical protein PC41400_27085 [Paenibacillus chitinolyticus]|uniref:Uncharacterized protein n=1 Tax=Paenibacillus chitinolyticus TaxID=79263 RepID=A0A410X3H4_9BACL|nr:hypothetical protein [Paenibacillus chitinolyticus]MCY9593001.1 hypothetical protein [Paenibacillus chitinolyticus]MCY9598929.1 hypothetical protein [Paenibacillus chitinolyticus]QAV21141.1 hypothetical protein PC41400_27085 [Paenibacillus chitinolyticus]